MRKQKKRNIFKEKIINYIDKNSKSYIIMTIFLLIGIILGIIFVNNTNSTQQNNISSYINTYINNIKNQQQISKVNILKTSIINNSITVFLLWFLGSTVIGMPLIYLLITYKGYSIGYAISSIIATLGPGRGTIFVIIAMLLQYIIYIPCIVSLAVSGKELYKSIITEKHRGDIKIQIIKHTFICIILLILMLLGSFVETYISGNLINNFAKFC